MKLESLQQTIQKIAQNPHKRSTLRLSDEREVVIEVIPPRGLGKILGGGHVHIKVMQHGTMLSDRDIVCHRGLHLGKDQARELSGIVNAERLKEYRGRYVNCAAATVGVPTSVIAGLVKPHEAFGVSTVLQKYEKQPGFVGKSEDEIVKSLLEKQKKGSNDEFEKREIEINGVKYTALVYTCKSDPKNNALLLTSPAKHFDERMADIVSNKTLSPEGKAKAFVELEKSMNFREFTDAASMFSLDESRYKKAMPAESLALAQLFARGTLYRDEFSKKICEIAEKKAGIKAGDIFALAKSERRGLTLKERKELDKVKEEFVKIGGDLGTFPVFKEDAEFSKFLGLSLAKNKERGTEEKVEILQRQIGIYDVTRLTPTAKRLIIPTLILDELDRLGTISNPNEKTALLDKITEYVRIFSEESEWMTQSPEGKQETRLKPLPKRIQDLLHNAHIDSKA